MAVADKLDLRTLREHKWRLSPELVAERFSDPGEWESSPHVRYMARKIRDCVVQDHGRLIVVLPPGHSKSSVGSKWTPTWLLQLNATLRIMLSSYAADFASEWGREVRNTIEEHADDLGVLISADSSAASRWHTTEGGGMVCGGPGSGFTGRRGHVFLIDDPIKNYADAHSAAKREEYWNFFRSAVRTRLFPGGSVVLILCLAAGSKIPLEDGRWVAVEDVRVGDRVWSYEDGQLRPRMVTGQRRSGVDETLRVRTDRMGLLANARHPVLVVPQDGRARPMLRPEWRQLGALEVGDLLVCAAELETDGKCPEPGWSDPRRGWLLGFLFGDGWVTSWERNNYDRQRDRTYQSRSWCVCAALGVDEELNRRVAGDLEEAFGRRPTRMDKSRYWRLDCNEAGRTLERLGLMAGVGAREKRLPEWLFGMPSEYQRAFIRGYIDADGTKPAAGRSWKILSANPDLLDDTRRLAVACGVRPGSVRCYPVTRQPPNSSEPVDSLMCSLYVTFPEEDTRGHTLVTGEVPEGLRIDRVRSIDPGPAVDVYDLSVDGPANFVAEGLIVHNTRWHEDDLAGRLQEQTGGVPWEVLRLPAIAEEDEEWRVGDVVYGGRKAGEALWPSMWPLEELELARAEVGSYLWAALYQGRPAPAEGGMVRRGWWRYWGGPGNPELPSRFDERIISVDCSFKGHDESDFVVMQAWARRGADRFLIDQVRGQMDFPETQAALEAFVRRHPKHRKRLVEDKANGPAIIASLRKKISGLIAWPRKGEKMDSKEARVAGASPEIEAGNVYLPHPSVVGGHEPIDVGEGRVLVEFDVGQFVEEWATFPGGAHDDQVDAGSMALLEMGARAPRRRRTRSATAAGKPGAQPPRPG